MFICVDDIALEVKTDSYSLIESLKEILPVSFLYPNVIEKSISKIYDIDIKKNTFSINLNGYRKILVHGGDKKEMHKIALYREYEKGLLFYFPGEKTFFKINKEVRHIKCFYNDDIGAIRFFVKNLLMEALYSKGFFSVHAAAIGYKAKAYLILGEKGAGKTTTLLNLLAYSDEFFLIANDRVLVEPDDYKVNILSADSFVRLTPDTRNLISEAYTQNNHLVKKINTAQNRLGQEKLYLPIYELLSNRVNHKLNIGGIIMLIDEPGYNKKYMKLSLPERAIVEDEDEHPNWLTVFNREYDKNKKSVRDITFPAAIIGRIDDLVCSAKLITSEIKRFDNIKELPVYFKE